MASYTFTKKEMNVLLKQIATKYSGKEFTKADLVKLVDYDEPKSYGPKKNRIAFHLFGAEIRKDDPKSKRVRKLWEEAKEKNQIQEYIDMAARDKERYLSEMRDWNAAIRIQAFHRANMVRKELYEE